MKSPLLNLQKEIYFNTARSSGKGGQHVNKTESKVELHFPVNASRLLNSEQKNKINEKLKNYINEQGELILYSQESRSQLQNKEICLEKFFVLLEKCLKNQKKRIPTRISKSTKERRLKDKKRRAEVKKWRGKFSE